MAQIEVISSSLIPMATDSSITISKIDLTPWELSYLLIDPLQKGILFHKPTQNNSSSTLYNLINHLKNSLSTTLSYFPPLAGRLVISQHGGDTATCFVACNNAGAEFIHAVAQNVSISDIIEPRYIPELVSSFFPLNGVLNYEGVSKPLLAVQVTELIDGYFIACAVNHCIVDGSSFWHFFNSWSEISRGLKTISKSPSFDRCILSIISRNNPQISIPIALLHQNDQSFAPIPLLERFFHFSKESIANLKAKANSEARTDKISSLQALLAHLWKTIIRIRNKNNARTTQESILYLSVGARTRIPLPEGYFGNAAYVSPVTINATEIMDKGLGFIAVRINEVVAMQTGKAAIKQAENWVEKPVVFPKGNYTGFFVSSSPRFDVYGCDFGWGEPVTVRSGKGQKVDGKMTFYPAADGDGIDVEVCLVPETMKAMEEDMEFIELFTI